MDLIPTDQPIVFTTSWCGYCIRLKSQLNRAGIGFQEIDIDDRADGAAIVAQVNEGISPSRQCSSATDLY